jgi:hypothetical protein
VKGFGLVYAMIVRIVASPPVAPHIIDEFSAAASAYGSVLVAVSDSDLNASCLSVGLVTSDFVAALGAMMKPFAQTLNAGRAFRIELMASTPTDVSDDAVRTCAVALHGAFSCPIFIARREAPAAAWAFSRPMPWGRKGISVGQTAPALPYGGSDCLGVALEIGAPTVLVKARLDAIPEHGLDGARVAVGGGESGFADVGAYAGVSAADGASVVALEFSDLKRSPIHRTLTVLDIECQRYGGRLGQVSLLSHVPLGALLDVLAARTGLHAGASQVLETHLPDRSAR